MPFVSSRPHCHMLIALAMALTACHPQSLSRLTTDEGPDAVNSPELIKIKAPITWAAVKGPVSYSLPETPWTDTYWPLYSKGLAYRFHASDPPTGLALFSLYDFLQGLFAAADADQTDPLATYMLSPAEKHDLLLAPNPRLLTPQDRETVLRRASAIDASLSRSVALAQSNDNTFTGQQKAIMSAIKKAVGELNKLARDPLLAAIPLTSASWGDWSFRAMQADNKLLADPPVVLGAMTLDDSTGNDWSWEGICHGWAPAAIAAAKPKHAVLAMRRDGRQILFNEGDIRGLLSKSWADLAPPNTATFLGSRCELGRKKIVTDRFGRTLDGVIHCKGGGCGIDGVGISWTKEFMLLGREAKRFSSYDRVDAERFLVVLKTDYASNSLQVRLFRQAYDLQQWVATQDNNLGIAATVTLQSTCRDMNPMLFHLLLTQVMARGQAFVMDRMRSEEVWNQPVRSYTISYESVSGGQSSAATLTPVDKIDDVYWRYRAPGTAFLLNATTVIKWVGENGPRIAYTTSEHHYDEESVEESILKYTLEFNAKQELIGGEWGHVPTNGQADPDILSRQGPGPDFAFFYPKNAEPSNRHHSPNSYPSVDYDNIVKILHACSRDDRDLITMTDSHGISLPVKRCQL